MTVPTVGRIVHYYAKDAFGDSGEGPYAAIVTKASPNNAAVNLMVAMSGWTPVHDVVEGKNDASPMPARYWVWPPRE
jgi:hypothetical protein